MDPFAERIAHVDIDAFFVAVERLRRPDLVGKPVLVGGDGPRSVVAAASYEARKHGVRSAMPMPMAKRMCPRAIILPPDHAEYRRVSEQLMGVLAGITPKCEPISVDEAFLDIGGLRRIGESPTAVAHQVRSSVRSEVGVTATVGVATTKLIAKMASRSAKPDGLLVVAAGTELDFLHPHRVEDLWGVGEATRARLEELGIRTIGDIAAFPRDTLIRRLGVSLGATLWDRANAIDDREISEPGEMKSISVEETYDSDLVGDEEVDRALAAHADLLARRLRDSAVAATTVSVKVRFGDFATITRSQSTERPAMTANGILTIARRLVVAASIGDRGVRLLGISGSGLVSATTPRQLVIGEPAWEAVDDAVGRVRDRFGSDSVSAASRIGAGFDGAIGDGAEAEALGIIGSRREKPDAPR